MTKENKLPKKKKIIIGGLSVLALAVLIGTGYFLTRDTEDNSSTENSTEHVQQPTDGVDSDTSPETPVTNVDDREVLDNQTIERVMESVKGHAYNGEWQDIVATVSEFDKEYNIDESEEGVHLREIFFDANTLHRLQDQGDTPEAVMEAVEVLPTVNTAEMFVLGLYYLPRNVLLELAPISLALAPTERGHVEIVERLDLPMVDEEGFRNEELDNHDVIETYLNLPHAQEFLDGFIRFDILNDDIEEYVYIGYKDEAPYTLIGFYSDDTNPKNTTKTVAHYLEFREKIEKGFDKWYGEEDETTDN